MIASIMISLREGLEASLIIGIVFSYLDKTNQTHYRKYAWMGVIAAILVSIAVALGIQFIGAKLEGPAEEVFEGVMMMFAVCVLTWMIFWMRSHARTLKGSLENELEATIQATNPRGLFAVTFFAVAREGVETALLLAATAFVADGLTTVFGTLVGLTIAVVIGVLVYASTIRLNMRMFFNVTSVLLLFFAAGLFMTGIHEFQEAGVIPTIQEHMWNISHILDHETGFGLILKALFGYTSSPSFLQLVGYAGYWIFALVAMPRLLDRTVKMKLAPAI